MQEKQPPKRLISALKHLLRPLVRLLLSHNITFPYLADLLKGVYVEVAKETILQTGGKLTDSRMSVLSGIHRKDIRRFRESPEILEGAPKAQSIGARMIGLWLAHPDYLDNQEHPAALSKHQFNELAMSVSSDIKPGTILEEWIHQGTVKVQGDQVTLNKQALIPSEDFEQLAHYFGQNLHDHIATASNNLLQQTDPKLERAVFYPRLSEASIQKIEAYANQQANQLLQQINKQALTYVKQDKDDPEATHRFRLGVYFYTEEKPTEKQA